MLLVLPVVGLIALILFGGSGHCRCFVCLGITVWTVTIVSGVVTNPVSTGVHEANSCYSTHTPYTTNKIWNEHLNITNQKGRLKRGASNPYGT